MITGSSLCNNLPTCPQRLGPLPPLEAPPPLKPPEEPPRNPPPPGPAWLPPRNPPPRVAAGLPPRWAPPLKPRPGFAVLPRYPAMGAPPKRIDCVPRTAPRFPKLERPPFDPLFIPKTPCRPNASRRNASFRDPDGCCKNAPPRVRLNSALRLALSGACPVPGVSVPREAKPLVWKFVERVDCRPPCPAVFRIGARRVGATEFSGATRFPLKRTVRGLSRTGPAFPFKSARCPPRKPAPGFPTRNTFDDPWLLPRKGGTGERYPEGPR